jgi:hypothetical protein
MALQYLLFYIMFGHLFPDLPELKARVFSQYMQAAQNTESGRILLGDLLDPAGGARMDCVVRNQFLTILMYRHLLQRMIGGLCRHTSTSKRNRMMTAGVLNRVINKMLTPHVSFVNLKHYSESCKIFVRCAMGVIVHQIPISVNWYNGNFQLSFTYPTCNHFVSERIQQLARPFSRLIDPMNEIWGGRIFVVWALYAKIILDLDDRKRFGLHENPARSVEEIVNSLTDEEILAIFSSYEFSTILRRYIHLHIGQNKIRAIEEYKRRSRELVWGMVESAMSESHQRERLRLSQARRLVFKERIVRRFLQLLESSRLTFKMFGSEEQLHELTHQIQAHQMHLQDSFPFIACEVLMELQNLVSVFFSVNHQFEIDLNELTFLVVWSAIHNLRLRRHKLVNQSKPWLRQSFWSHEQIMRSASPELILFFAIKHSDRTLPNAIHWFSDQKRQKKLDGKS